MIANVRYVDSRNRHESGENVMIRKKSSGHNIRSRRCGAAMVEMALVLPVFLILLSGIIEFGRGFMVSQLVMNAAREGSRMGALGNSTETEIETRVDDLLNESLGLSPAEVTVTSTVILRDGSLGSSIVDAAPGSTVYVEVSVPFESVTLMNANWLGGSNLRSKQAMRKF